MTPYITIGIVVAVLVILCIFFPNVRLPGLYRNRNDIEPEWRQRFPGDQFQVADSVLKVFCDAFMLKTEFRFKLSPDDKVMDVYRAHNRWRFADSMEIEHLVMDLDEKFGVAIVEWSPSMTIGELVDHALKKQRACQLEDSR